MSSFAERAQSFVDDWPAGGRVVGVLPDPADPGESGRAVLELIEAAGEERDPTVVLDLAPEATDLTSRFGGADSPGLADVAAGEIELWEIVRRDDAHDVLYVPRGSGPSGSALAGSEAAEALADRIHGKGGLLLVLLDSAGAEAAAAAGYLDESVRLGASGGHAPAAEPEPRREERVPPEGRQPPRVVVPPDKRSPRPWWRTRRGLLALAVLIAAGLGLSAVLGGPGPADVVDFFTGPDDRTPFSSATGAGAGNPGAPGRAAFASSTASDSDPESGLAAAGRETPPSPPVATEDSSAPWPPGEGTPRGDEDTSVSPRAPGPRSTGLGLPELDPASGDAASFRAVSDSLGSSIEGYHRRAERLGQAEISCAELLEARGRAGRLFRRLWLYRMSLQPRPDPAEERIFRERAGQMDSLQRSFESTGCPGGLR